MSEAEKEIFGSENLEESIPAENEEQVTENIPLEDGVEGVTTYGGEQEGANEDTREQDEATEIEPDALTQAKERAAFYQQGYQEAQSRLKELDPNHQEWNNNWKEEYKNSTYQPQMSEQGQPLEQSATDKYISDFTEEEFKNLISMESKKAMQQSYQEAQRLARLENEMTESRKTLVDFVNKFEVTEQEIKNAGDYARSLGLDDRQSPKSVAKVVVDHIYMNRLIQNSHGGITRAQASAAEKVKQSQMVQQPSPSAMPEQRKLTKEEKLIEQMKNVGRSDANSEVFG